MKSIYILAFLFVLFTARGQTYIPAGFVSGTWENSDSPYIIQGNIEIHFDSTLVIEPGVEVLFDGSYKLTVHGLLDASGTEADSILFTAVNPVTGWQGIEFIQINEDLGISNVKYCTLTYGKKTSGYGGAIYVYQADNVLISNCQIMNNYANGGGGIYIDDGWIVVKNSLITNNSADSYAGGIACIYSVPSFNNLQITYNTSGDAGGFYFANNPSYFWPSFDNLTISNNEGGSVGGILLEYSIDLMLNNSKITNNRGYYVGGIALVESRIWSPFGRNQVYMNIGGLAQELYYHGDPQGTVIHIDTFTVINPDRYLVYPLDKFNFGSGILYGLIEQADTNLFISETGSDTNDGLSPQYPLRTFDFALRKITSDPANNNTLWVMPGHYHLSESESVIPIYLKDEVRIKAMVPGEAILDGDSTCRVLFGYYKDNFTLSGLTVQNGTNGNYLGPAYEDIISGGGLSLFYSQGTIDSCKFAWNFTAKYGGGVHLGGNNSVNFNNSEFYQNMAEFGGGGVDLIENNNVNFNNCKFIQNTALYGGGGLFTNNNSSGPLNINNCLFSENYSGGKGGGLNYSGNQFSIKNSQFIANTSVLEGAGCYCHVTAQLPGFINCLFSKNISEDNGGGIYFSGITVSKLINCTFSDNQAISGSAVYQLDLYKLYCINTIFWNTEVPSTDMIHVTSTGNPYTTGFYTNYSDIQGGEASIVVEDGGVHWETGNITSDPAFVDPSNGDYSLNWNSPCIEAGKEDTTGLNLPEYDLNDNPRIVNPRVDMGAYEFQMPVGINLPYFANNRMRIYPAVTDKDVNVELPDELLNEKLIIRFYYSDGKILKVVYNNTGNQLIKIDVSDLPAGIYFIVVEDNKGRKYSERMIISG